MKKYYFLITVSLFLLITGCSELKNLQNMLNVKNPDVKFEKVELTGLSFEKADLMVGLKIINPNDFTIKLDGFDYELLINQQSFLSGNQDKGLDIKANNFSIVQLPLALNYEDLFKTYENFKNDDLLKYTIKTGLTFDLPVVGKVRVPVSKEGELPSLKIPSISFKSLKIKDIGFSGADMVLEINIDNPNISALMLNTMDYNLNVNGKSWISGEAHDKIDIKGKEESTLTVPFKLNFLQMGQSVYQLITGNSDLNVEFKGNADLNSSLELLKQFNISVNENKSVKLTK